MGGCMLYLFLALTWGSSRSVKKSHGTWVFVHLALYFNFLFSLTANFRTANTCMKSQCTLQYAA